MKKKYFIPLAVVLLAGLAAGTFLDLHISSIIYDPHDPVGIFVNMMAMGPSFLLLEISCCMFSIYNRNNNQRFTGMLLALVTGASCCYEIGKPFELELWISIIAGILLAGGIMAVVSRCFPTVSYRQYVVASSIMFSAILIFLMTESIKNIWGRRRFYSMDDPLSQFMAWFIPKPLAQNDFYKSFPSGHTAFSTLSLYAMFLPEMLNVKVTRRMVIFIGLGWIATVMYGRIVYGAHFLSDTCMGALIGITSVYLGSQRIEKRL